MNRPEVLDKLPSWQHTRLLNKEQQIISTIALLILGYYVISFLDVWPSTLKRSSYEFFIYIVPSPLVYVLQRIIVKMVGAQKQEIMFRREDFNDVRKKEEVIRYWFGQTPIPTVLKKARTLSGYDRLHPPSGQMNPPGLGNWDNSCYQNSVLQGLASLPALQAYLHRNVMLCEKFNIPGKTTHALAALVDQLADSTCQTTYLWTPPILKSMDSWQQQDAQEYFSRVSEALEKEATQCVKVARKLSLSALNCLLSDGRQSMQEAQVQGQFPAQFQPPRVVQSPMDGTQAQSLKCQSCGFSEGLSFTHFNCLTLNLGLGGECDVRDLLDAYAEVEPIEGVECDECTRQAQKVQKRHKSNPAQGDHSKQGPRPKPRPVLRTKIKQVTLGRLPRDLVININRSIFDDFGNQRKNTSFVHVPERLEILGRWCAPVGVEDDSVQEVYELRCMVTHSGRHDNGHYVAFAKRAKDWYCFNDENVTMTTMESVLRIGSGFILFYEAADRSELVAEEEDNGPLANDASQAASEPVIGSGTESGSSSPPSSQECPAMPVGQVSPFVMKTAPDVIRSLPKADASSPGPVSAM